MGPETREINQPENRARMGKRETCDLCRKEFVEQIRDRLPPVCPDCEHKHSVQERWWMFAQAAQEIDQIRLSGNAIANRIQKLHEFRPDSRAPYPPHMIYKNDLEYELHEIDELAKRVLSLTESLRRFLK